MRIVDRRPLGARLLDRFDRERPRRALLLRPLRCLYRVGFLLHERLRPGRLLPARPLSVVVGNLRVGGTGKTPVTAALASSLSAAGFEVAVVSRGYRAQGGGDEPAWLEQATGARVLLDVDRRKAFDGAAASGAEVVLLDDGLQARDRARLRIAVVLGRDLLRPPALLPEGPLREPMEALSKVDMVLVRREGDDPGAGELLRRGRQWCSRVGVFRLVPVRLVNTAGESFSLEELSRRGPCLLVSGLARPVSFERDALEAGARAVGALRYADHASFGERESMEIARLAEELGVDWILCPQKNLDRLAAAIPDADVVALESKVVWEGGDDPLEMVRESLSGG